MFLSKEERCHNFSVLAISQQPVTRASRPRTSRTEENVKIVTEILASDRCVSARLIEELLRIPKNTVHQIFTEDLDRRKVCARFVPHSLSGDEKHVRVERCKDKLRSAQSDTKFTKSIVTGDETRCFQYEQIGRASCRGRV
jgi:hypothetical protein